MALALLVSILLQAAPAAPQPPGAVVLDRIAAVVGDDILLESEVDAHVDVGVLPRREGEGDDAYRERVQEERIVALLREGELRKTAGFEPETAEVEFRVRQIAERVERERGAPFEEVLARAGVTQLEVTGWVRRGLALEEYARERLLPLVKVSDAELSSFYHGAFRVESEATGLAELPPLSEVQDQVRAVLRERKLNAEIERWTNELRARTRVLVYRRPRPEAAEAPGASPESR